MVDWAKRITKAAGDELRAGEHIVAATLFQPTGTTGRIAGAAAGGVIGAAIASKIRKGDDGGLVSDQGIAATVPDGPLVVGLTSGGQVLLYKQGSMSGKPKELEATLARDDIAAIEVEPGKVVKTITVAFADGTGKVFETPRLDKSIDGFVDALG